MKIDIKIEIKILKGQLAAQEPTSFLYYRIFLIFKIKIKNLILHLKNIALFYILQDIMQKELI